MNIEKEIATRISALTGLEVGEEHVHESVSRFYYIQEAKPGCAYLLHHYRGPFFVEINKEDWKSLQNDELSVEDYIDSVQWYFGYYWGGGSMVSGGFYTPLEGGPGIHNVELIYRIMTAIKSKGRQVSCGAALTTVEKEEWAWAKENYLRDIRVFFFEQIDSFVQKEFGYKLHGLCCDNYDEDEIYLTSNFMERTFSVNVSENLIQKILMGNFATPDPSKMKIFVQKGFFRDRSRQVNSTEEFQEALVELGIIHDWEVEESVNIRTSISTANDPEEDISEENLFQRIMRFFRR